MPTMASTRLEDYALIGDRHSAALVSRDGSIDWLCLPRFDSDACFAALLGGPEHGCWQLRPSGAVKRSARAYRPGTLILETRHETETGTVVVVDFMRPRDGAPVLVRMVRGERGKVDLRMDLVLRFGYGSVVPWVRKIEGGLQAIAGPDLVELRSSVDMRGEGLKTVADFSVREGDEVSFVLTWSPSHAPNESSPEVDAAFALTEKHWTEWSSRYTLDGPYGDTVHRSLLTLKALTYAPTGGIVAAPTTSLPECIGGSRNWDYRYCWLRDATFTLYALMSAGYADEATAWRDWLLRAVAGKASQLQTLYGLAGESRIQESVLPWLPGYEGSAPVRIGNAASSQLQIDVWGEVIDALYLARRMNLTEPDDSWSLQVTLVEHLETLWREPDEGIWEVRGPRRHFTHSKVMAWVAFDRAVKSVEDQGLPGPVERWRAVRDEIHASVCDNGFDPKRGTFVQSYGADSVDGSLLMLALVGFLPASDPRIIGTVRVVEEDLLRGGFVARYRPHQGLDGQQDGEGIFLPCSFWLVDNYVLQGRTDDARALFDRLLALCNDVGLLSEEYDPVGRRLLGNFPQAFSHVSLVNSARNLSPTGGPAHHRQKPTPGP
jgi:GH15 family glucan-1,4-alpha-glucosidase